MRYMMILLLAISLSGCGMPLRSSLLGTAPVVLTPTIGMTRAEVSAIMLHTVTVGYEADPTTGTMKPLEVKSLYSSEVLSVGNETYVVDSYITGVPQNGSPVTEAMMTPMIFKNDILSGKGREALAALKAGNVTATANEK